MQCPKCPGSRLVAARVGDIELDRCEQCGGIWFDKHELVPALRENMPHLTASWGKYALQDTNQTRGQCPRDAGQLLRVSSAPDRAVIVDACPECRGIRLDGGECDLPLKGAPR